MKNFFCIFSAIVMLCSLCACKSDTPPATKPEAVKTTAAENPADDLTEPEATQPAVKDPIKELIDSHVFCTNISKDHVPEFIDLLGGESELGGLLSGFSLDEEHCFNVTPPEVAAETNMKIFKFSDSCISCVWIDDAVYELCVSFGGYGFVNAVPCDFDNDGNKDLLVASSWGSGLHRSIISVFNSVSKESTILYDTSSTANPGIDLFVAAVIPAYSSIKPEDAPVYYAVYSAKISVNDHLADLSYTATNLVGFIEVENGAPIFKPAP